MAVSGARRGHGGVVRVGRGTTTITWTTLVGVGDFTFPARTVEEIDVTSHSSPVGTLEFIPGSADFGSVGFTLDYVEGNLSDVCLLAIEASRELVQLGLKTRTAAEERFVAFLSKYERGVPVKGVQRSNVTFRVSGTVA